MGFAQFNQADLVICVPFFRAIFHAGLVATGDDNSTAEDAEIAEFIIFSASSAFSAVILRAVRLPRQWDVCEKRSVGSPLLPAHLLHIGQS
jgi:hypothetical protein